MKIANYDMALNSQRTFKKTQQVQENLQFRVGASKSNIQMDTNNNSENHSILW